MTPDGHADGAVSPKLDARTARWAGHRDAVRSEIVDRAFEAISGRLGADASLNDIVAELGFSKPKIYRFFDGKSDLFWAITDRVRDEFWSRVPAPTAMFTDTVDDLVRRIVTEFVRYVDENPDVIRFIVRGQFTHRTEAGGRPFSDLVQAVEAISGLVEVSAPNVSVDKKDIEFVLYTILASCGGACDWWLGIDTHAERVIPLDQFVDRCVSIVFGLIGQFADDLGVVFDRALPLHQNLAPKVSS
jgi:AcrR family transcriptional regulator